MAPDAGSLSLCGAPASACCLGLGTLSPCPSPDRAPVLSQGLDPWRWIFLSRITMIIIYFCIINYHLRNWFILMHKLRAEKMLPLRSVSPSPLLMSPQQDKLQGQVLTRWSCSPGAAAPQVPPGSRHADRHSPFQIQRVFAACVKRGSPKDPREVWGAGDSSSGHWTAERWTAEQGEAKVAAGIILHREPGPPGLYRTSQLPGGLLRAG